MGVTLGAIRPVAMADGELIAERGRYAMKAGGSFATMMAYAVMMAVFSTLSALTCFQVEGLEVGRIDSWDNAQRFGAEFRAHMVGIVNPEGGAALLRTVAPTFSRRAGLVKRIANAVDQAIFKGFLDNTETWQKCKLVFGAALAIGCLIDRENTQQKIPLAISAGLIPLLGMRRLGFSGTLITAGATYGFYQIPAFGTIVMGIGSGLWQMGLFVSRGGRP